MGGGRGLVPDAGQFGCLEAFVALEAGFERKVEHATGEEGAFDGVGRAAGLEQFLDLLGKAAEVVVGPAMST